MRVYDVHILIMMRKIESSLDKEFNNYVALDYTARIDSIHNTKKTTLIYLFTNSVLYKNIAGKELFKMPQEKNALKI